MPSLNAQFAESGGNPIEHDGALVHPLYRRQVKAGEVFTIRFVDRASDRPQAVVMAVSNGQLDVEESRSRQIILWQEAAPETVVVRATADASLDAWNAWRHADGVVDEWTNNAGMLVSEAGDTVTLRISDGVGEPSFEDLVVELHFGRASTPGTT